MDEIKDFQISKYYSYYDVVNTSHTDLLSKNKIAGVPYILQMHKFLVSAIDPICEAFNTKFLITSGFRCQELNRRVGSTVPTSRHTRGLAVDIQDEQWNYDDLFSGMVEVAVKMIKLGLPFHKIILEKRTKQNKKWIHISGAADGEKISRRILTGIDDNYVEKNIKIS